MRCMRNSPFLALSSAESKIMTARRGTVRGRRPARTKRRPKTKVELYHAEMRKLMRYITSREFNEGHKWSTRQLKSVMPEKIMTYLKQQVYGDANTNPDKDPPVHHRTNSVLYWKKAWSYFMLDQGTPWSDVAKVGNPTRSAPINRLVKAMRKMEAARRGKPSQARRALRPIEFEAIVESLQKSDDDQVGV